jgi:hypothetical protein
MTDTPARNFIIKSEIGQEKHFFMPSQNHLSIKENSLMKNCISLTISDLLMNYSAGVSVFAVFYYFYP